MNDPKKRPNADEQRPGDRSVAMTKCAEIQQLLTDYIARELGDSTSAIVREHLRRCPACQAIARDLATTFDVLKKASAPDVPERLSDKRRARIRRAFLHPIIGWIEQHHVGVSIVVAIIVVVVAMYVLVVLPLMRREESDDSKWGPPTTFILFSNAPPVKLDPVPKIDVPVVVPDVPPTVTSAVHHLEVGGKGDAGDEPPAKSDAKDNAPPKGDPP